MTKKILSSVLIMFVVMLSAVWVHSAEITVNVLAVNNNDSTKEKEIRTVLPKELSQDDILDTDGLELGYDITTQSHYVHGTVTLEPKATRTFRIRVRDLWQIEEEEINEIKEQVDLSVERMKDTEYYETSLIKQESLLQRLDYIVDEQKRLGDNVEARINRYRVYDDEIQEIRDSALSVHYWRTKPVEATASNVITFVVSAENTTSKEKEVIHKHYLPSEVKPEHLIEIQDFEYRYDPVKRQPFLTKEETLQAEESKRYDISVLDVWRVLDKDMEDLRDRARTAYGLLENTIYKESAGYLIESIKENLDKIEASQAQTVDINQHVSRFRTNTKRFHKAEKDVEALEELLEAVREELERSKVKNVLNKIKKLSGIQEIAKAIFQKPELNLFWKIIIGICIFVGIYTIVHFSVWGARSKGIKEEELEDKDPKDE